MTINSATFYVYSDYGQYQDLNMYACNTSSTATIVSGDYDIANWSSVEQAIVVGNGSNGWHIMTTLTPTDVINTDDISIIGIRTMGSDVNSDPCTTTTYGSVTFSEYSGTNFDPRLEVEWSYNYPDPPTGLTSVHDGSCGVDLSWTPGSGTGTVYTVIRGSITDYPTSTITGYAVYSGTLTACNDTSATDVCNNTYYYSAWTYDDCGLYSETSATASYTHNYPTLPLSFTATDDGGGWALLTWTTATGTGTVNTMIRGSYTHTPTSITDGYYVYYGSGGHTTTDYHPAGDGHKYYYSLFTWDSCCISSDYLTVDIFEVEETNYDNFFSWLGGNMTILVFLIGAVSLTALTYYRRHMMLTMLAAMFWVAFSIELMTDTPNTQEIIGGFACIIFSLYLMFDLAFTLFSGGEDRE